MPPYLRGKSASAFSFSLKVLKPLAPASPNAILSVHTETGELMAAATLTAAPATPAVEPKSTPAQQLRTAQDLFIRRWGEMGATWGINRTMAEIHALLYITAQPLCTDDVMERLNISRGNASMSLRALRHWGIIRRPHKRGEPRGDLR